MASTPRLYDYPLARGIIDSVRLNLAHFIWKKEFPWIAHPSIELQGRADLRIADVGCGTGWVFSRFATLVLGKAGSSLTAF